MGMDKKNHPQVYLDERKYKIKKIQMSRFINTELKSDSERDSNLKIGSKFDAKLMVLVLILNNTFYFQASRFSFLSKSKHILVH